MKKKKLTIRDIAGQLNVSKTAISFILNGKARENHISKALEKKVLKHIKEVGYRPNQFAQGLRAGKTKIIGMMVEDISDPFFSLIARMIEENAYSKGYKIIYCSTENNTQKTKELIQVYRARQVDGYIIAPPPGIEGEISELIEDDFPVVIFDRPVTGVETDTILVNNYESSYEAVTHFIKNGYSNIAMVTLASDQEQMIERQRGYEVAMAEIRSPCTIARIIYHEEKKNSIRQIQDFLVTNKQIDAVFFSTNYIAESGLEAIINLGIRIPDQLGVIVFDDYNLFRLFTPPITAISQPIREISEQVINLMLERLSSEEKQVEFKSIELKSTLVVRKSSSRKIH